MTNVVRRRKPEKLAKKAVTGSKKMSTSAGWCRRFVYVALSVFMVMSAGLLFAYLTSPISSISVNDGHDITKLKWAFRKNSDLEKGKKIIEELHGPESFVVDADGNWYTGTGDGRIVKITNGDKPEQSISDVTEFADYWAGGERKQRRPLGLRLMEHQLYVADAYQGIFVINLKSKTWDKIVGYNDVSPPMALPDDLTISKDGSTVYFTDASARWMCQDVAYSIVEAECTGRVFRVTLSTRHIELVRDNLCFPNGIQLNPDETVLLVSEASRRQISVIDATSGERIKTIPLHGGPDNIRPAKSGGYWVAIGILSDPNIDILQLYPFIRDIVMKILGPEGIAVYANLKHGTAVRLDENFNVVSVHYDREGKVCYSLTEINEYEQGKFLLGTFAGHGIVKLEGLSVN